MIASDMTHAWLFVVGVLLEGLAILVFAAPDFVPGLRRFARWIVTWIVPRLRRAENRLRRLLGLPGRPIVVRGEAAVGASAALSAKVRVAVSDEATLEEKVDFLLRRDQEGQDFHQRIWESVEAVEARFDQQTTAMRDETVSHVAAELEAVDKEGRALRLIGAVLLVAGLACQSIASLL
jgi:hypothetical protein